MTAVTAAAQGQRPRRQPGDPQRRDGNHEHRPETQQEVDRPRGPALEP